MVKNLTIISAENPLYHRASDNENYVLNRILENKMKNHVYTHGVFRFFGKNEHPLFLKDISFKRAVELAREFKQGGIIRVGKKQVYAVDLEKNIKYPFTKKTIGGTGAAGAAARKSKRYISIINPRGELVSIAYDFDPSKARRLKY